MKKKREFKAEIFLDKAGYWRWRIFDSRGRVIARSAHSYLNEPDCKKILLTVVSLKPMIEQDLS